MAETILHLPQMVDLALNTPEVGVVNFTILHSLMQVIISYLDMDDISVQFKGADSERVEKFIKCAKPGSSFTLKHHIVGGAKDSKVKPEEDLSKKGAAVKKEEQKYRPPSIVLENTVAISKHQLETLENELKMLKTKVAELAELPADTKLIEALSDSTEEKRPVLDMYQILNLTKRLDAVEMTVEKFATMLEAVTRVSISGEQGEEALQTLKEIASHTPERSSFDYIGLETRVKKLESVVKLSAAGDEPLKTKTSKHRSSSKQLQKMTDLLEPSGSFGTTNVQLKEAIETLREQMLNLKNTVDGFSHSMNEIEQLKDTLQSNPEAQPLEMRLINMENKLPVIEEQLASIDNGFSRQVNSISNRISDLELNLGELQEKINLVPDRNEERAADLHLTAELHNQLTAVQDELKTVEDNIKLLLEERENRQNSFDALAEQVELLKAVKADREDLEDALADKADACLINRKVSFEQFDQACGDMSKSIEEALAKLTQQETLWSHALDDLQKDVGSKMDRMELNPLRDFINTKLKNLQDKFKTLTALKKEHEAAGTKSKYLRNVNCISCDKDVVMRKEIDPSMFPKPAALPPNRSMGPYLAYELDQLRKQQKCLPSNKNLNMFENALLSEKGVKSPDHICNRYCGGSHTVTTPQQRVARVGHFLEQWGPEIAPINDVHVRGTDGQMYKSRDDVQLKQLANDKPPSVHPEQKSPLQIIGDISEKKLNAHKMSEEDHNDGLPPSARSRK